MLPTGREYFVTFLGVMLAGAVPVPIYPPARSTQLADHLHRHSGILSNAKAVLLVTVPQAVALGRLLRGDVPTLRRVVVPGALRAQRVGALPAPDPQTLALLQYTSGSTGRPKGVVLTHHNLVANIRAMGRAASVSSQDTFVSWLPLYHDMGLIGAWLSALYFGFPLVVMAPQVFLTRPARWLWAMHTYRGSLSASPNFGYQLCLDKVDDAEIEGLDLSSWRLAFNGAEPVMASTVERFGERFSRYGLRSAAMTPVYGLAESAVGLAFPPLGRGARIETVARESLERLGMAEPAEQAGRSGRRLVACGQALMGHQLRVVDGAGQPLGDRQVGRIEFRGPSATRGYFRNPDATRALFDGDWLDTGDLGYLAGGDLFITGRLKDTIIRAGRNLSPDELEEDVGSIGGVRKGCVAVFAVPASDGGAERLVILAETRLSDPASRQALEGAIVARTVALVGTPPDDVVLAPPGSVLKTSSGKVRRGDTRERYRRGAPSSPEPWSPIRWHLRAVMARVRPAWTALGSVIFTLYAGMALVVVGSVLMVLLALTPHESTRRRQLRAAAGLIARVSGTKVMVHGLERLPSGACVVVANHASWLDGMVLDAVLPPSFCFVVGEVFEHQAVTGFVLRRAGSEFVQRGERTRGVSDTDRLVGAARSGQPLVVFPEGELGRVRGLRPFHLGAFTVAARAGVPVVPVAIQGTRTILAPGRHRLRRGSVHLSVGDPLWAPGVGWAAAVELSDAARRVLLRATGEADLD